MSLTSSERASFTAAKLAEIDRWSAIDDTLALARVEDAPEPTREAKAAHRAKVVGQLANMSVDGLRARVNITGIGAAVNYSADDNYTQGEKNAIAWGYKGNVGRKWGTEIPAILAHKAEMEADGLDAATVKAILKAR